VQSLHTETIENANVRDDRASNSHGGVARRAANRFTRARVNHRTQSLLVDFAWKNADHGRL
jgi:hypothetical protein